jgi:geranylgeranyl reductase family protein
MTSSAANPQHASVEHTRRGLEAEVIVVGSGPAGSTAARTIAEAGASVLLLDRARFPRDKPCGGGVTIRCANLLPFSIEPVVEDVITAARLRVRGRREVVKRSDEPITYMTQRRHLDAFLVERAQEAGVEFRDAQAVRHVRRCPGGGFEVETADGVHRSRVVIGADGANGIVGNRLGYERHADGAVALEGNIPFPGGVPDEFRGTVVLNFGYLPGGYAWIFPKGDHVNVGVGGWQDVAGSMLRPALQRTCRLYGLDPDALEGLRGHHLPMQRRGMTLAADGSALVGDAAGLVDPLSGEGIYAALVSGGAVAQPVRDYLDGYAGGLGAYQAALQRDLLPEVETSAALMDIFHAWPEPFVWLIQHTGPFWTGACRLVRGDRTYVDLSNAFGAPGRVLLRPAAAAGRRVRRRAHHRGGAAPARGE